MPLAYRAEERNAVAEGFLADQAAGLEPVVREIHAQDEMFHFALEHMDGVRDLALFSYLRSGLGVQQAVGQILRWAFPIGSAPRILDFASGYGRATRFLARELPPQRLWIAEIHREAVDYQCRTFGVQGLVSSAVPEELNWTQQFDAVLAASFLSHTPPATFERWLAVLIRQLAPEGILVFSVHDQAVLLPGRTMPAEGIYFERISECETLSLDDYGATWVTEPFVARALRRVAGESVRYRRLERALWHLQDLYVVTTRRDLDLDSLVFDRGPEGYLSRCERIGVDGLRILGWAVDHGPLGAPLTVEVQLAGQCIARCAIDRERPDVVEVLGEKRFLRSGWECSWRSPEGFLRAQDLLLVKARSTSGAEFVLHLGPLDGVGLQILLRNTRAELAKLVDRVAHLEIDLAETEHARAVARAEVEGLTARIAAMEESRFWKLRARWWRLRTALGIPER